jgi:hypothetical protein
VPGCTLGEADAQRPRSTASHARRPLGRFADRLKDVPCILKKELAGRTQLHAARKTIEKFEAEFVLQIHDLSGKSRLSYTQSLRRTPVVLLLADHDEISKVP